MKTPLTTLPTDTFVSAAFQELLQDVTNLLASAETQKPRDKAEVAFWRRQLNALNKAESYFAQGVRPTISGAAYLLPSASRPGALIHRLTKHGGIVVCSCEAGQKQQLCWHHMLINVLERAAELESLNEKRETMNDEDAGPDSSSFIAHPSSFTPEAARALLSERLQATAAIIDAMRAAQGRSTRNEERGTRNDEGFGPASSSFIVHASSLGYDPPIDIPEEPQPQTEGGPPPPIYPEPGGYTMQLGQRLAQARRYLLEAA